MSLSFQNFLPAFCVQKWCSRKLFSSVLIQNSLFVFLYYTLPFLSKGRIIFLVFTNQDGDWLLLNIPPENMFNISWYCLIIDSFVRIKYPMIDDKKTSLVKQPQKASRPVFEISLFYMADTMSSHSGIFFQNSTIVTRVQRTGNVLVIGLISASPH